MRVPAFHLYPVRVDGYFTCTAPGVTLAPVADEVIFTVGVAHQKLVLFLPSGDEALLFEFVGLNIEFDGVPG